MKRFKYAGGFTLVELLVTVVIMAILMGLVVGLSGMARRKSTDAQARAELQFIASALEEYKLAVGLYPPAILPQSTKSGLNWLTNQYRGDIPGGRVELKIDQELKDKVRLTDPWTRPYQYTNVTRYSYKLYSMGALEDNPDDDIIVTGVQ
jgi:general secretion pathway protein G